MIKGWPLASLLSLFDFSDLQHIRRQVQVDRGGTGTYDHISLSDKISFFQNIDLIREDIIQAFLLIIVESTYTPAQTQLVDQ